MAITIFAGQLENAVQMKMLEEYLLQGQKITFIKARDIKKVALKI
jgi:hypothetical protein